MVNSVRPRPTYYEMLGITPAATDEQISQAFAKKVRECRWDLVGASARICIAYETLSDRFKRADYDRSHGLEPKPRPRLAAMALTQRQWAPFIASAATNALGQSARATSAEPQEAQRRDPEGSLGTRPASPVSASPRETSRRRPQDKLEADLRQMFAAGLTERTNLRHSQDHLLDWKRPALAAGGFVVAAGLIGALAGVSLKDDESASLAEPPPSATTVARQHSSMAIRAAVPVIAEANSNADWPARPVRSRFRMRLRRSRHATPRVGQGETEAAQIGPAEGQPKAAIVDPIIPAPPTPSPSADH